MRHVIAGTAGHIDHGKTALVRALTGIDTDRLQEEKRRGISIDLGFAHLDLSDDIRIALVDVPGHEKFVKNMLAGVGAIDIVLFVVAADESIKPQTREHLDICRLLRVPSGVVALTKADAVDSDILELVSLEVQELMAGTFLEKAAIVPVSALTGEGLGTLREALRATAGSVRAKSVNRIFRMPVDRAFTMTGFGTVVTGTVLSGSLDVEGEVQVYPGTKRFRVRGIQVHGAPELRALAGQRAALNLAGDQDDVLKRGVVLSRPGLFEPTTLLDCSLDVLESAGSIKNGTPVHFHTGTAEIGAEVRILGQSGALQGGQTHIVRIALREPTLLLPGDRFIIRRFSPVVTIGGGHVIDAHRPRLNRAATLSRARALDSAPLGERIRIVVEEHACGISLPDLVARTGESDRDLIASLPSSVLAFGDPPSWMLGHVRSEAALASAAAQLQEFHRAQPLAPGMSKEELRTRYLPDAPPFVFAALVQKCKDIVTTGELAHSPSHRVALADDEKEALRRIEDAFEKGRLAVPGVADVLQNCGVEAARAKSLLQILLRSKRLLRVTDDLVYHSAALDQLRTSLEKRKGQAFSVADFKEWTGVSRKYAIPLLEFLDREKITRRQGEARVVL
jgi:selenocysteine-specific elongation factor